VNIMRKRIINQGSQGRSPADREWLDVERLAQVELTSEDPAHPIESALTPGTGLGWRAAEPGQQIIRLLFDKPLRLRCIRLVFHETEEARTQELVLRWSPNGGQSYREIVRQQYTFSPPHTCHEVEDFGVDLAGVMALELRIVPDISGGSSCALLAQLRLA
jgi:hypothetical protein